MQRDPIAAAECLQRADEIAVRLSADTFKLDHHLDQERMEASWQDAEEYSESMRKPYIEAPPIEKTSLKHDPLTCGIYGPCDACLARGKGRAK